MAATSYADQIAAQDSLRPIRNFVSLLSGAVNDQTWAGEDAYAVNTPGRVQVQGPNGVAVEGKPVIVATAAPAAGPFGLKPVELALLLGVAAWFVLK